MAGVMTKRITSLTLAAAAAASVAVVGVAPAIAGTTAVAKAPVSTRHTSLGTFLVDGKGRTLYLFQKDKKNVSKCGTQCVAVWPAALAPNGVVAKGSAKQSLLGRIKRSDGTWQITYAGHPLYRYSADTKVGQIRGQGVNSFGANWYVVQPSGTKIDND